VHQRRDEADGILVVTFSRCLAIGSKPGIPPESQHADDEHHNDEDEEQVRKLH
jgi:hypothetical protein